MAASSELIRNNEKYKKRPGTASGVHGQFYESKVLSLLNFRAQHDADIEEFYLATNVDLIGEFDDICIRAKVKGFAKQMAVFAQAKHREADKVLSLSIKQDLTRYFGSYLKIKRAFGTKNKDKLFGGTFNDTECLFVMYTNAKYDFNNDLVETEYTTKLKELIGTNQMCSYLQPTYETEDVELLSKAILEEEVVALAEHFAKLINKEVIIDDLVSCYHYILAQKVFEIPDIGNDKGHRIASFRNDFFDTNEHFVLIFRNTLYERVLLRRKIDMPKILILLDKFFSSSSDVEVLSELIVAVIAYKNGKFEFVKKSPDITEDLKRKLNEVNVLQSTVDKAIDQAGRKELKHSEFKVPPSFGNKDLTIKKDKEEGRLDLLSSTIVGLITAANPNTIITIEESLGDGLLKVNGGLAGAVGNVFVPDENYKLMKFADNIESVRGDLAKKLYLKLKNKINNLGEYRINVKVKEFPKLSFHSREHDENLVKDFLGQLIFFTNQSKQQEIDEILKQEMARWYYLNDGKRLNQAQAEAVFLTYHKGIQDWWIAPNEAKYLTKHCKHFENATKDIMNQSLIYAINMIHTFNMQNMKYTFNAAAVKAFYFLLEKQCKTNLNVNVIVTDNCKFTVVKLTYYLNDENNVVLDLGSISKLLPKEYAILLTELAENKETVIFVNHGNWCERLNDIVKVVKAPLFIVTKAKPNKIDSYTHDFANNLIDLSDESQQTFLMNTKVIFQEEEVSLGLFVKDEKTRKLIKGDIFNKMLENTVFKIGMPIGNQDYDELKHLYTDRRVSRTRKTEEDAFQEVKDKLIQTLNDLQDHVILVTAMPGMGKSTLLTHLSFKTKELDPNTWIVRINLLEFSNIFNKLQKDKTVIDHMLSLYFMCYVALGVAEDITVELQTENNVVSLEYCSGDASNTFEVEMFLQFYNNGTLIFLFDGFDEIFPHYAKEALSLVKTVMSFPRQHKIWITSRSYNHIKEILEEAFGRSYELEGFSEVEQVSYLRKYFIKSDLEALRESQGSERTREVVAPCHCPLYFTRYYPDEQTTMPSFKIWFSREVIFRLHIDGRVEEVNQSTSNSNVMWEDDSNTEYHTNDFFANPLHLYLLTVGLKFREGLNIITSPPNVTVPGLHDEQRGTAVEMSACELYQHFVETKLNKIRFTEKNKVNLAIPDNISINDRERAHVLSKHKKLGAYAVFYPDVDSIFSENELKEVRQTIDMLKLGTEKSGFIHSVAGDIPLFTHKLIAEYFAAGYIDDLLKSAITDETRESILGLSNVAQVYETFASKRIAIKDGIFVQNLLL